MIAIIGALTLVLAGTSAVFQRDIKRVLAYSTMSQIGYMFLALGVGAWSAAIFHFMAHAFFKSLLFLSAGVIILGLDHEHDLYRMGGLRRRMPVVFWTMLIGGSSLAGIPLVTAGFYSKDLILWSAWSSGGGGGFVLWLAGLLGTFLTGLYIFRLIFLAFFGEEERKPSVRAGWRIYIALVTLAFLAIVGGFINAPRFLGRWMLLSPFLEGTFGPSRVQESPGWEGLFSAYASLAAFLGILAAWWWFLRRRPEEDEREIPFVPSGAGAFWRAGWDFDLLYDTFFVRPYAWLAGVFRSDPPDRIFEALARLTNWGYLGLRWTQNGRVRWYAAGLAAGTVIVVAVMVFLR